MCEGKGAWGERRVSSMGREGGGREGGAGDEEQNGK